MVKPDLSRFVLDAAYIMWCLCKMSSSLDVLICCVGCSTTASLELYGLNLSDSGQDMELVSAIQTESRYGNISYSASELWSFPHYCDNNTAEGIQKIPEHFRQFVLFYMCIVVTETSASVQNITNVA